jgi:hypothetical protein
MSFVYRCANTIEVMAKDYQWWDGPIVDTERMAEMELDVEELECEAVARIDAAAYGLSPGFVATPWRIRSNKRGVDTHRAVGNTSMQDPTPHTTGQE